MQTIQVVLDERLLLAADCAAHRVRVNRSALVREALRQYLKKLRCEELERRDREVYQRSPQRVGDVTVWEEVAVWPKD